MNESRLDPRAWLAWGVAASLPALLGRNPFPIALVAVVALAVRFSWSASVPGIANWSSLIRLAVMFAVIGVVFNVLTVRSGDRVIARIPDSFPLLGGELTLNALFYGLLSALAALTLVLIGATVAASLDWAGLTRMLPPGLTTLAVAGSVAFSFLPQTAKAYVEIREAQAARGHRTRGMRDLAPLLTPLLTGGLERALTLAESLESRGFGAQANARETPSTFVRALTAIGLSLGVAAGYSFAVGRLTIAALTGASAAASLVLVVKRSRSGLVRRTSYREMRWRGVDSIVAGAAGVAAAVTILSASFDSSALRYEPYPSLTAPAVGLPVLIALLLLLAPAFLAPRIDTVAGSA